MVTDSMASGASAVLVVLTFTLLSVLINITTRIQGADTRLSSASVSVMRTIGQITLIFLVVTVIVLTLYLYVRCDLNLAHTTLLTTLLLFIGALSLTTNLTHRSMNGIVDEKLKKLARTVYWSSLGIIITVCLLCLLYVRYTLSLAKKLTY